MLLFLLSFFLGGGTPKLCSCTKLIDESVDIGPVGTPFPHGKQPTDIRGSTNRSFGHAAILFNSTTSFKIAAVIHVKLNQPFVEEAPLWASLFLNILLSISLHSFMWLGQSKAQETSLTHQRAKFRIG